MSAEPGDAVVAARGDDPAAPVDVRAEVGLVADDDAAGKRQVPVIQKDAAAPALPGARRGVLESEGAVSDGEGPVQEQGPAEALRVSLRAVSGKGAVADVGELRYRDADGAALGLVRALAQVPRKGGAPDLRLLQLQEERAALARPGDAARGVSLHEGGGHLKGHRRQVQYFHLVPQIIRDPSRTPPVSGDPYGSDFIAQMNATSSRTRDAWLRRMQEALSAAVPGFESLTIEIDPSGRPHLIGGYKNWRSSPSHQSEADFSDGTLRLIGLLWAIIKMPASSGVLLLEEPELSLNSAIVRVLPH